MNLSEQAKACGILFLHCAGVLTVGLIIIHSKYLLHQVITDVVNAYVNTLHLMLGQLPYRDFPLEYPPLAIISFYLPHLAGMGMPLTWQHYGWAVFFMNTLFSVLIATVLWRMTAQGYCGNPVTALSNCALMAIILAPLMCWRYDLLPALLTVLALQAILNKRPLVAGVWLGLGIMVKLYPVVLLPVFALYYLATKHQQALKRLLGGVAIPVVLSILPFVRVPLGVFLYFIKYHQQRGLEFEALPAGLMMLAHNLFGFPVSIVLNFEAFHLVSPLTPLVLECLPAVFLLSFAAILLRAGREFRKEQATDGQTTSETLVRYVAAALLLFIVANKVLSAQYVIWLLPFAPLLRPNERRVSLAILILTIFLFPFFFDCLLLMNPVAVLLLNVRNLLLVALLGSVIGLRLPVWNAVVPRQRRQSGILPTAG